ncbi:MAG: hypothetical protein BWX80_03871 [Candidatus Hydrogenedentes bacterium ADurb.Bin101]|nr:MAG: hypothetical protein BWX80_03871 [Candidatus Hydrogenedentes bacterium ADurb.Bin101]
MDGLANHPFADHRPDLLPRGVAHALGAALEHPSRCRHLLCQFLGQFELPPVRHRLFAIDVLARRNGIQGLVAVDVVRRGDGDQVHGRVGQQFPVVHVSFRPVTFRRLVQPRPVHVAHGDNPDTLVMVLDMLEGFQVAVAAPAAADNTDAQHIVRGQRPPLRQGGQTCRRHARQHRMAQKGAAVYFVQMHSHKVAPCFAQ